MKLTVKKTFTVEMTDEEAKQIVSALDLVQIVAANLSGMKDLMQNPGLNAAKYVHMLKDSVGSLSVLKMMLG